MAIMKLKIIKRDWKLPNLSHFTYTSIVQCILQVLYSFKPGLPQKVAISKRSKIAKFVLFYMQKYCATTLHSFKPGVA